MGRICRLADQETKAEGGVWSSNVKATRSGGDLWLCINGTSGKGRVCSLQADALKCVRDHLGGAKNDISWVGFVANVIHFTYKL